MWAPLPFASNRTWGIALLFCLLAFLQCVWLILYLLRRCELPGATLRFAAWPLLLLALLQVWIFAQSMPLPLSWLEALSPTAFTYYQGLDSAAISLDRSTTRLYWLKSMSAALGFVLCVLLISSPQRLEKLLWTLVLSGTLQAAFAVTMVFSGLELGFFVEKYVGRGSATGTFVNRNHLAGYLVMSLAAGIGLFLAGIGADPGRSSRARLRQFLALLLSARFGLRIFLAVMVIGLVMTHSRLGNLAFFVALVTAGAAAYLSGERFPRAVLWFLGSLFAIDLLVLGRWFGFSRLVERMGEVGAEGEARLWSGEFTLKMLGDFPLTGSGGGSFYSVFPNYQGAELHGFYRHAHNDYLEFAVELGIPAAAILVLCAVLCLWHGWRVLRQRGPGIARGAAFAVIMAGTWAALHAGGDFCLQIPANALNFAVIMAVACVARGIQRRPP